MPIRIKPMGINNQKVDPLVYLDGQLIARMRRDQATHFSGTGQPQRLTVRIRNFESDPIILTDPGDHGWLGLEVVFGFAFGWPGHWRKRRRNPLRVEVLRDPGNGEQYTF